MSIDERRAPRSGEWADDPWDDPDGTAGVMLERSRRRSGRALKSVVFSIGLVLMLAVVAAGGVGLWYLREINPQGDPGEATNFTVEPTDDLDSISTRLQELGLISNAGVFRWYVERNGGLELIPGYYRIRPDDHMGNVMLALSTPPDLTYTKVTFPEGFTLAQIGARLEASTQRLTAADLIATATNGTVTSIYLPPGVLSLEGLLFPDTYEVSNGETSAQVLARMVALMERVGRQEDIEGKGAALGLTPYQVLTIASMVEREAKVAADRPLIARVILNRLYLGMPLGIDATLLYGQDPNLSFDELKAIDSPYNTYMYPDLPPTPIASPGRASIQAVLNPAPDPARGKGVCEGIPDDQCRYLYYVLADSGGGHAFAVTLAQHEANIEAARQAGVLP
jgi:UPF0755 protein